MAQVRIRAHGPDLTGVLYGVFFEQNVSRPLEELYAAPRRDRIALHLGELFRVEIVCAECAQAEHQEGCASAPPKAAEPPPAPVQPAGPRQVPAEPPPVQPAPRAGSALGSGLAMASRGNPPGRNSRR